MDLSDLELQLEHWHKLKFGTVDLPATVRKLGEEIGEFHEAILNGDPDAIEEEAADVLFVMTHIVRHYCGVGALNRAAINKLGVIHERLNCLPPSGVLP